jgi:hypothetical protein
LVAAAGRAELAVSVVFGGAGGAGFHGSFGPLRGAESPSPFGNHRNDSENEVILAERFRNTTSEERLSGEKTCQGKAQGKRSGFAVTPCPA